MKTASYLKDIDIFSEIAAGDLRKSKNAKICKNLAMGELIADSQDCQDKVFIIEEGLVRLYELSEDGREQTLDILPTGAFFGDLGLETDEQICVFANAEAENTTVCIINKHDFFKKIASKPDLALKIISSLAMRLLAAQEKIGKLALADAKVRLLSELVRLGRSFGVEDERTIKINKRFTHEQLANLIGTTRETVTKTIKAINKDCEGCVVQDKYHFFILNKIKVLEVIASV